MEYLAQFEVGSGSEKFTLKVPASVLDIDNVLPAIVERYHMTQSDLNMFRYTLVNIHDQGFVMLSDLGQMIQYAPSLLPLLSANAKISNDEYREKIRNNEISWVFMKQQLADIAEFLSEEVG